MKNKTGKLTEKELQEFIKALNRMKEWQYLVTFCKVWPYVSIKRANIITLEPSETGKTIDRLIQKELASKTRKGKKGGG